MQNNIIDIMIKHMYNYPRIMKRQFKTRINQNSCIEIFNFQNQNLKSFYHGKTELEKRQFYIYFEIIMERKKDRMD